MNKRGREIVGTNKAARGDSRKTEEAAREGNRKPTRPQDDLSENRQSHKGGANIIVIIDLSSTEFKNCC